MSADANTDDQRLLRSAADGSREALAEVARRYVGFVYAAALRQVRDPHLAEDVTQAVFVILARKVRSLKPGTLPHAWLFATTRYAAANALKLRARRTHHERKAAAMREHEREDSAGSSSSSSSDHVTPLLDEALASLRETDRSAVLLSYFAGKSWDEVGRAIGTSEEAARKRASRAVAQLRAFFALRGVQTTGAAVVAAMTSPAKASVPPALLGAVTSAVTSGGAISAAGASTSSLIAKGVIHMMTWAHVKVAAAAAVVFLTALGGASAMVMRQTERPRAALEAPAERPDALAATLENGVTVELVAVSRREGAGRTWWNPDGSAANQTFDDTTSDDEPSHTHQVIVRVGGPQDVGANYAVPKSRGWSSEPARHGGAELPGLQIVSFRIADDAPTTTIRVNIAAGEWETLTRHDGGRNLAFGGDGNGEAVIGPIIDSDGRAMVTVCDTLTNHERRVVVVDQNGDEPAQSQRMTGAGYKMHITSMTFPVPVDEVAQVRFMARPFDQFVEFKDVSLAAGKKTEPKVEKGN